MPVCAVATDLRGLPLGSFFQLDIYSTPAIANPLSPWLVLLVLALPGIYALGAALARRAVADAELGRALSAGVALSLWLLLTHVLARVSGSFGLGLLLASLALSLAGAWPWLARRQREAAPERSRPELPASSGIAPALRGGAMSVTRWAAATAVATTACLVPIAWRWAFHDELNFNGHMGLVSAIQNDAYPPRNSAFPDLEQPYHYGVDLFAAVLTALFRLPVDHALDVTLLLGWGYSWFLSWILGERLVGPRRGWLLSVMLLLAAGYPFFCWSNFALGLPLGGHLLGACVADGLLTAAPTISNFFQHPWSLGVPVALCAIAVSTQRGSVRAAHRLPLLGLLVTFLSLCQFALFVALVPTLVVAEAFSGIAPALRGGAMSVGGIAPALRGGAMSIEGRRFDARRAFGIAAAMLVAVAVATQLGGFLASSGAAGKALELQWSGGTYSGPRLMWFWTSLGLSLPLGLVGLFYVRRERLLFGLLALGSLLTLVLFRYRLSWDIVKFAQVAHIGLALPAACLLARLLSSARSPLRFAARSLLALSLPTAIAFTFVLVFRVPGAPAMYQQVPPPLSSHEAEAASWLRRTLRSGELVYRRRDGYLSGFWCWAGLPGLHVDPGFVLPEQRFVRRTALIASLPTTIDPYRDEGVRYMALDASDAELLLAAQGWMQQGTARLARSFGPLQVIEILDSGAEQNDGRRIAAQERTTGNR